MSYLANGFRLVSSTTMAVVAVGAFALLASPAEAAPLTSGKSAVSQSDESALTLVRDGCGRGMRWSNRRGGCVPAGGGGPGFVDPGAAIIGGVVGGIVSGITRPAGCPRGTRWSNRRGGCVYY